MLKNYFKIAWRQLKKQRLYSVINIMGLAMSIACCLLIALYIKDELNYDQHHSNVANIYRVAIDTKINVWNVDGDNYANPPILGKTLLAEIPEITSMARLNPHYANAGSNLVRREQEKSNQYEENFVYADPAFLDIFDLPLIHGSQKELLTQPNTVVITERIAEKYFRNENPVGEVLVLNDDVEQSYRVTGVIENIPAQSNFDFDFFMSMSTLSDAESNTTWVSNNYYTYVTLADEVAAGQLTEKLKAFSLKNFAPQFKEVLDIDVQNLEATGQRYNVKLQPFSEVYLYSNSRTPVFEKNGDIRYVKLFALIALFIFFIAIINFINLSTARSANRAKEVGLRKVLGSAKQQLVGQFLAESVFMGLIAFLLGGAIATIAMPFFNNLADKNLSFPIEQPMFWATFLLTAIGSGLLAGLYPSLYLSAFKPIKVLKGTLSRGSKSGWLRSGLVTLQFAISIGLIVGTIIVYHQLSYIQNKNLGFKKEQVLLVEDTYTLGDQLRSFKEELAKLPEVISSTTSSYLPLAGGRRNGVFFKLAGTSEGQGETLMQSWAVDEDYVSTLDIQLKEGRAFNAEMPTDSQAVILNETAINNLGLTNPIGKKIAPKGANDQQYTIIGVVEDFYFESLNKEVEGLGLFLGLSMSVVSAKVQTENMDRVLAKTEQLWKSFAPTLPFRYTFLDDRYAKMYVSEDRVGKLFSLFSLLAILIACLGLFALATFMTEQRAKEIGIRKVLGASLPNIVYQLSKNFMLPVLIGLVIAIPITYLEMSKWLENFAYRIDIQWWMFVLAGVLGIGIAFLTVGIQSVRAALANPIKALRDE